MPANVNGWLLNPLEDFPPSKKMPLMPPLAVPCRVKFFPGSNNQIHGSREAGSCRSSRPASVMKVARRLRFSRAAVRISPMGVGISPLP